MKNILKLSLAISWLVGLKYETDLKKLNFYYFIGSLTCILLLSSIKSFFSLNPSILAIQGNSSWKIFIWTLVQAGIIRNWEIHFLKNGKVDLCASWHTSNTSGQCLSNFSRMWLPMNYVFSYPTLSPSYWLDP